MLSHPIISVAITHLIISPLSALIGLQLGGARVGSLSTMNRLEVGFAGMGLGFRG